MTFPTILLAEVGSVTEFRGNPAEVRRDDNRLTVEMGFGVEMMDRLITANTRLGITFGDQTRVEITEQSQLIIDDFVYDPNTGVGRIAMNVALGTVQMTSGRIARTSRENVDIRTPTASITVRGTDFSMTVDEIGRSLIILLPSCEVPTENEENCSVGSITVTTDAGSVDLNKAYHGTLVTSSAMLPADPRRLLLERANINNNLIIVPPTEFPRGFSSPEQETETNHLSVDLLAFEELSEDLLEFDDLKTNALDVDRLSNSFLDDLLTIMTEDLNDELSELDDGILPNIRNFPWIQYAINEEFILIDSERTPHIAMITVASDTQGTYTLTQGGVSAPIQMNDGGTNVSIRITQSQ